jgi:hypothetical protein
VTYSKSINGPGIYGYAFLSGVDTVSPVRSVAGLYQGTGTGSIDLNYDPTPQSGDFAFAAAYKNSNSSISMSPNDQILYNGYSSGSFSGLVGYDANLAGGTYSSHFGFVGTDREVGAGVIMAAAQTAFVPDPDITGDGDVDMADFAMLAAEWLNSPCTDPVWCDDADIDHSGAVDIEDFIIMVMDWLN